jgi:predicted amidophosphoribosyltransferase
MLENGMTIGNLWYTCPNTPDPVYKNCYYCGSKTEYEDHEDGELCPECETELHKDIKMYQNGLEDIGYLANKWESRHYLYLIENL